MAFAEAMFAELDTRLDNSESMKKHLAIVENSAMLRGRLVKLHNIVTYFINTFKNSKDVAKYTDEANNQFIVRLKPDAEMHLVADNIGKWAKIFIDNYKNPTDFHNIQPLIENILFGKGSKDAGRENRNYEGMFELVSTRGQGEVIPFIDGRFNELRSPIYNAYVKPISQYLRFNKGEIEGTEGQSSSLTLKDVANGFATLKYQLDNPYLYNQNTKLKIGTKDNQLIDLTPGSEALSEYIVGGRNKHPGVDASQNPFDVAMRSLHSFYNENIAKNRNVKKPGHVEDIMLKVEAGVLLERHGLAGEDFNRQTLTKSLWEYVKNDMDFIELSKIQYRIQHLHEKINELKSNKFASKEELENTMNIKIELEGIASDLQLRIGSQYDYENGGKIVTKVGTYDKGFYTAGSNLVFWNSKGEMVGTIMKGAKNQFDIKDNYLAVVDGRRFALVSPEVQKTNYAKQLAFGTLPMHNTSQSGDLTVMTKQQYNVNIAPKIKDLRRDIDFIHESRNSGEIDNREFSVQRKYAIARRLAELESPLQRKAFIWSLLNPRVDRNVIAYHKDASGKNINSPHLIENHLAKPMWGVLLDIANKDANYKQNNISNREAKELIQEIIGRQTLASIGLSNLHIEVALRYDFGDYNSSYNKLKYAELNRKDIKDQVTGNVEGEHALEMINEWVNGERIVSPQDMFLLEKKMNLSDGLIFITNSSKDAVPARPVRNFGSPKKQSATEWVRELATKTRDKRKKKCTNK